VGWEDVTASDAVENADWIGTRLHPFKAYDVGAVIPTGFAAYARILHPAFTREREVRWAEVASWSGRVIHPEVQFHALVPSLPLDQIGTEPFVYAPRNGVLPESQVRALVETLSRHTSTAGKCWFCLWEGQGYLHEGGLVELRSYRDSFAGRWARWRYEHVGVMFRRPARLPRSIKRVTPNPQRSYLLFTGRVTKAAGWRDGPNIWWPDDRAWCVASEIDFPYTYVGGSRELIDAILKRPELEALPSDVRDRVTYDSDNVNSPG
jgi:hypothetical protein